MNLMLKIAWRNVWRNKRRTIISILAVVFAVALPIFSWSFKEGEYEQMIDDALKLYPGHVQVHAKGYWDDKTIYNSFAPPERLLTYLKQDRKVEAYTTRLSVDALVSSDSNTSGVLVMGVVPGTEFSSIKGKITKGAFLSSGDSKGIVIGDTLAKNLNASVGSELTILTQAYDGSMGAGLFTIRGIFRTGSGDVDRSMALIDLPAAQYLLSMDGLVTELTVFLADSGDTNKEAAKISALLERTKFEVMPWPKLIPDLVQLVQLSKTFGSVYYLLILLVVGFGILNTILMAVIERYREFGVMMALGTRPSQIVRLILMESAVIALIGIVIGDAIGFGFTYYFTQVPMNFSAHSELMASYGLEPFLYAKLYPPTFWVTDLVVLGATLLSALYPAAKASRLSPVRALTYI